jgi:hypothetical protein
MNQIDCVIFHSPGEVTGIFASERGRAAMAALPGAVPLPWTFANG